MPSRHADAIELLLRDLPAPQREILIVTYFRGRTTREAARLLKITPAEAAARLYQAMRSLAAARGSGSRPPLRGRAREEISPVRPRPGARPRHRSAG